MTLRLTSLFAVLVLASGCPSPPPPDSQDAGSGFPGGGGSGDAAVELTSCISPQACAQKGVVGVCRDGFCRGQVPCEDDVECGLGEACEGQVCRFVGCTRAEDCSTGRCDLASYTCAECGTNAECPADRPVCGPAGTCLLCATDDQCPPPGPGYCDAPSGTCVHCKLNEHCPAGLACAAGVCVGAQENESCAAGISCAQDLVCVQVGGGSTQCRKACNLYTPSCPTNQLCLKLTFTDSPSLVFEQGAPLGICSPPPGGLKFYKEACGATQVCQPNLSCVQDSPTASSCKAFCDPAAPACQTGEQCHPYPGDFSGREYGLCYPDTGVGQVCTAEAACRSGLSCGPVPDPSAATRVSAACRFPAATSANGLSPCATDAACKSGFCANDTAIGAQKFFCYAACEDDADCFIGGRTGYCDNNSNIAISPYPATTIRGCRPSCDGNTECATYRPGFVCRMATTLSSNVPSVPIVRATCANPLGTRAVGEACTANGECKSSYCYRRDSRGQTRPGVCTAPCADGADCSSTLTDGGTASLPSCLPTVLNHTAGNDGVINTGDDRDAVASICATGACTDDADCPSRFPRCAPDADPATPAAGLVLRCRGTALGSGAGGSVCGNDSDCLSGACAELVPPAVGAGRVCLQPCNVATGVCGPALTCRVDAARLLTKDGTAKLFTACVP